LALLASCNSDSASGASQEGVTETDHRILGLSTAAIPTTRADSIKVVRSLARVLAIALGQDALRGEFNQAFKRSGLREGKLVMQKFVRARGTSLAQKAEQRNGLNAGDIDRALRAVEPLELYLPIPDDRQNWTGTDDVLVAGFLETEDEIRQGGGTVIAYDIQGREHAVPYESRGTRPVIVLTNAETESGEDGESAPAGAPSSNAVSIPPSFLCIGCPLPRLPPDPCATTTTGTRLHVCRTNIPNVSRYEGALRGAPEVSLLLFSVPPGGTGATTIGCLNEDKAYPEYYNQE
jgi:hypothetical protein